MPERPARRRIAPLGLYAVFFGGWVFASLLVVRTVLSLEDHGDELPLAGFFVAGTGVLIGAIVNRDFRARVDVGRLLDDRQQLIVSIGLVTDPRLTQLPMGPMLEELLDRTRRATGATVAAVFLVQAGGSVRLRAVRGMDASGRELAGLEEVLQRTVLRRRSTVVLRGDDVPLPFRGTCPVAVASPLLAEGELLGVLVVADADAEVPGDDEVRLVELVADRAATAIDANRHADLALRANVAADEARSRLTMLAEAGGILGRAFGQVDDLAAALADGLVPRYADWCTLYECGTDAAPTSWTQRSAAGVGDIAEALATTVAATAEAQEPRLWSADELHAAPTTEAVAAAGLESLCLVPVPIDGHTGGVLAVGTTRARQPLRGSDLSTLRDLAGRVGVAIERELLAEETRDAYADAFYREQRLKALHEATPVAVVELDSQHRPLRWNAAAGRLFGWSAEDGAELTLPAAATELVSRALEGGATSSEVELRVDGEAVAAELIAVPFEVDGARMGTVLAGVDLTERKQVAERLQQAQRLESMGQLAGGIAHDFNNALMVVLGYTDLLGRRLEHDPAASADVQAIKAAAQRAAEFTRKLLTISRRQVLAVELVDLSEAVAQMGEVLRVIAGSAVRVDLRTEPAPLVLVDPGQFEQVVLNLTINARDAMPDGGTVTVGVRAADDASAVVLTVADTGVGMDAATAEHCFEPFFTTKDRSKGTGLGLSTVHAAVVQAGGTITVASRPGEGTTFTVTLPAAEVDAGMLDEEEDGDRSAGTSGPGSVLVVDDEPDVRRIVGGMLERRGWRVATAEDLEEALLHGERLRPDVLLTDVHMPRLSGPELAARYREVHPGVHVVYMSADVGHGALASLGPDVTFLAKPFSVDELVTVLERQVQGSKR